MIAPQAEVVNQWSKEFEQITEREMTKVTGSDGDEVSSLEIDLCATWFSAVQGLQV